MNQEKTIQAQNRRYAAIISELESQDIVCSLYTAIMLQDCAGFEHLVESQQEPSWFKKIGRFGTKSIYIDMNLKFDDNSIFDIEGNLILDLSEYDKIRTEYTAENLEKYLSEQHRNTRHDAIDVITELRSKMGVEHEPDEFTDVFEKMIKAIMNLRQRSPIQSPDQTIFEKINLKLDDSEIYANERMLELIRLDRPGLVINEVKSVSLNGQGYYDVEVDMECNFFGTKILHVYETLQYPYNVYEKIKDRVRPIVQPAPQPRK